MRDSPGRQRLDLRRGASGDVASSLCASTSRAALACIAVPGGSWLLLAEELLAVVVAEQEGEAGRQDLVGGGTAEMGVGP